MISSVLSVLSVGLSSELPMTKSTTSMTIATAMPPSTRKRVLFLPPEGRTGFISPATVTLATPGVSGMTGLTGLGGLGGVTDAPGCVPTFDEDGATAGASRTTVALPALSALTSGFGPTFGLRASAVRRSTSSRDVGRVRGSRVMMSIMVRSSWLTLAGSCAASSPSRRSSAEGGSMAVRQCHIVAPRA